MKAEYKAQKENFKILKDQYEAKVVKLENEIEDLKSVTDEAKNNSK